MYCKHCGKPIDKDSVFCTHCGKQLSEIDEDVNVIKNHQVLLEDKPASQTYQQSDKKDNTSKGRVLRKTHKKIYLLCLAGALCIFALWGLLLLFDNNNIADITIDKVSEELVQATKRYDRLYDFHEGLARVEKNDKYGFIDKLGHEIIPCKYDEADDFEIGIAIVKVGEKAGAIDMQGKMVIPCIYEHLYLYKDSTIEARLNDMAGIIGIKGETIVSFEYDNCDGFHEGLASVEKNGLRGFVNKKGKLVIPCKYEADINHQYVFSDGLAAVKKDGLFGYIDHSGNVVIPFDESLTGMPFSSGLTTKCRGGNSFTIDRDGQLVPNNTPFEMAIINKEGQQLSKWHRGNIKDFRNGYSSFQDERGLWGLIDIHGNVVIPCAFTLIAYEYGEDGYFWVSQGNDNEGFFNINTGSLAVPCIYDLSADYRFKACEGLIAAKKDGKCGYINLSNETVIPFIYDDADNFSEGFAVVERYGKYGYVDRYGSDTFSVK